MKLIRILTAPDFSKLLSLRNVGNEMTTSPSPNFETYSGGLMMIKEWHENSFSQSWSIGRIGVLDSLLK